MSNPVTPTNTDARGTQIFGEAYHGSMIRRGGEIRWLIGGGCIDLAAIQALGHIPNLVGSERCKVSLAVAHQFEIVFEHTRERP